jgi:predicted ATPase
MRRHELLALENPEVHLHPSLQLEIGEFLAGEAKTGKYLLIETHSDLVVRRIMSMMLDEKIRQEEIRLYFTEIVRADPAKADGVGFDHSILRPIAVDDRGRIERWPEGFMDDAVRESRRLLTIMYGSPPTGRDENDDNHEGDEP